MNIGEISLDIRLNESSLDSAIAKIQNRAKEVNFLINPRVNHTPLKELNQHLDLKVSHLRKVNQIFEREPLTPFGDARQLDRVEQMMNRAVKMQQAQAFSQPQARSQSNFGSPNVTINLNNRDVINQLRAVERAIKNSNKKSVLETVATGGFEAIGDTLTKSIFSSLRKDLGINVNAIARPLTKFIAKPLSKVTPENKQGFEDDLVDSLEQLFIFKDVNKFKQKIKLAFKPAIEELKESVLESASSAVYLGAQPLRIRKRVLLAQSAQEAQKQSEGIKIPVNQREAIEKAQSIALVTGGIDYQQGGANTDFAENLVKRILPGAYSVPVKNPWSNDKDSLGKIYQAMAKGKGENGEARAPMPLDKLLQVAVEKGYNPDSIHMAGQAMAYRKEFPDKPINLLGTSGGSYVVEEAIAILQRAGIDNVKGAGITAPFAGLTGTAKPGSFTANVGDLDPLYLAMFGGKGVKNPDSLAARKTLDEIPVKLPGLINPNKSPYNRVVPDAGVGHALLPFLAEPTFQANIKSHLGSTIGEMNPDYAGQVGIRNLDALRVMGDENKTIPRTLKAIFGDKPTLKQIEQAGFNGADGYTFAVPQKPDWRRDNDFKSMQGGNLAKKGKKATGEAKEIVDDYAAFLKEMEVGLVEYLDSGAIAKGKLIGLLDKAVKLYPELVGVQNKVIKTTEEYVRLVGLGGKDDKRSTKEKYSDNQRLQRLQAQGYTPDNLKTSSALVETIKPLVKKEEFNQALTETTAITKKFQEAYAQIKASLSAKDFDKASTTAKFVLENVPRAKSDISNKRDDAGIAKIGTEEAGKVNQLLGQLSQVEKKIKQQFAKAKIALPEIDIKSIERVGSNIPLGLKKGIESNAKVVGKSAEGLAEEVIVAAEEKLEIQSPSKVFQRIGEFIVEGLQKGLTTSGIGKTFENIVNTLTTVGAIKIGIDLFKEYGAAAIETAQAFESIGVKLQFATGSVGSANSKFEELKNTSRDLGTNLADTVDSYASLAAATRDTPLEGYQTEKVFKGFTEAGVVQQLSREQQQGLNLAVQQIAGKGVVQQEELRGQIGERLLGSQNTAARSRGQSVQELNRDVKKGIVTSEEFLPQFAQQLSAESALTLPKALQSSVAIVNRYENAITELQATLGKPLLDIRNTGLTTLTPVIDGTVKALPLLINLLGVLSLRTLAGLATQLQGVINYNGLLNTGFSGLRSVINTVTPAVIKLGVQFVAFTLAVEVIRALGKAFSDASGELKGFADQSENSFKSLKKLIDETKGLPAKQEFKQSEDNTSVKLANRSNPLAALGLVAKNTELVDSQGTKYLKESAIGQGLLGFLPDKLEKNAGFGQQVGYNIRNSAQQFESRFGNFPTKAKDDRIAASSRLINTNNETINATNQQLKSVSSAIKDVQAYDKALQALQLKRRALVVGSPGDVSGLKEIQRQETEILKKREAVSRVTGGLQGQGATNIEALKKSIEELDRVASIPSEYQNEYRQQADVLRESLKNAEESQISLNRAIKAGLDAYTLFGKRADSIVDGFTDSQATSQVFSNEYKRQIFTSQAAGGISPEQAGNLGQQIDLQASVNELSKLQSAIAELAQLISERGDVLQSYGVTANTGEAQLTTLVTEIENPNDKLVIQKYAELKKLQAQSSQLGINIAQQQAGIGQALRDASKAVNDFYRELINQAAIIANETKQIQNTVALNSAKTKLKTALLGFQDTFVSSYVEGLLGVLETLNKPLQDALAAQQQLIQQQQSTQGQLLQSQQLQRQSFISIGGQSFGGDGGNSSNSSGGYMGKGAIASPSTTQSLQQVLQGSVSQGQGFFGKRARGNHTSIDFDNTEGLGGHSNFQAMFPGKVKTITAWGKGYTDREGGENSNAIRIATPLKNGGEFLTDYGHYETPSARVQAGQNVGAGTLLGRLSGNDTGSQGGHLDVKIRVPSGIARNFKTTQADPRNPGMTYVEVKEFMRWYAANEAGQSIGSQQSQSQVQPQNSVNRFTSSSGQSPKTNTQGLTKKGQQYEALSRDPRVAAFLKAIAVAEVGAELVNKGGGYGKQIGGNYGKDDFQNPSALTAIPASLPGRRGQNAFGRYQIHQPDFDWAKRELGTKNLSPQNQDTIGVQRLMFRGAIKPLLAGNIDLAIKKAGNEFASLQGSKFAGDGLNATTQGGKRNTFVNNYQRFLNQGVGQARSQPQNFNGSVGGDVQGSSVATLQVGQAELQQANSQILANSQQQAQNIQAQLASSNQLAKLEAKLQKQKTENQFEVGLRDAEDGARNSTRRLADMGADIGIDTPQRQREKQKLTVNREYVDFNRDLVKQLTELENARGTLSGAKDVIKMGGFQGADQLKDQLPAINDGLIRLDDAIAKVRGALDKSANVRTARLKDIDAKAEYENEKRTKEQSITVRQNDIQSIRSRADIAETFQGNNPGDFTKGDPLALRKQADYLEAFVGLDEQISQLEELERQGLRTTDQIEKLKTQYQQLANQSVMGGDIKYQREVAERLLKIEERDLTIQAKKLGFDKERADLQTTGTELYMQAKPFDFSKGNPVLMRYNANLKAFNLETKQSVLEAKQFALQQGFSTEATNELINSTIELSKLKADNLFGEYRNNADAQTRDVLANQRNVVNRFTESKVQGLQGQADTYDSFGLNVLGDRERKAIGKIQLESDLQNQIADLNEFARTTGLSTEKTNELRDDIEALNQVKINQLDNQYSPWLQITQSSVEGLKSSLAGLLNGTMSFGEAFQSLGSTIADTLAKMAADWAVNELVQGLFGNKLKTQAETPSFSIMDSLGGGGGGSGGGGLLSGLLGSVLGFAGGGEVPMMPGNGLRDRKDSIGAALRKEGNNSVLAALTPGEHVLNLKEAAMFRKAFPKGIQVMNFNKGGVVPGKIDVNGFNGGNKSASTFNVNVPISYSGESGGGDKQNQIGNLIKAAVVNELNRQHKPGGMFA